MAKKKESGGAPKWMSTFADLSTLLMTFFVLMLSMANVDIKSFREMLGSIKEGFGVQLEQVGKYQATIPDQIDPSNLKPGEGEWLQRKDEDLYLEDIEDEHDEKTDEEKAAEIAKEKERKEQAEAAKEIQEAINQTQMGDMAEVQSGANGIRIRVKGALMFSAGQAALRPEARPFLDSLVQVLQKFEYNLLVEGHTDSSPISTAQFPSNWELSGDRASAVLRYLITWGIDPGRMTSVGLADNYPLDTNETEVGRAKNRRVEFVLTKKAFRPEID